MDLLDWTNVKISIKTSQGAVLISHTRWSALVAELTGGVHALIGGAAAVSHSWLADGGGLAEESGSGQHTDHRDVTDSIAAAAAPRSFHNALGLYSLSQVPMSYRSARCSVIYFPLSPPPPHVFICSYSSSRPPFMLILALCLSSSLSPLPHVSVLLAHHGSALLTLTEGSHVAEGRGLFPPLSSSASLDRLAALSTGFPHLKVVYRLP